MPSGRLCRRPVAPRRPCLSARAAALIWRWATARRRRSSWQRRARGCRRWRRPPWPRKSWSGTSRCASSFGSRQEATCALVLCAKVPLSWSTHLHCSALATMEGRKHGSWPIVTLTSTHLHHSTYLAAQALHVQALSALERARILSEAKERHAAASAKDMELAGLEAERALADGAALDLKLGVSSCLPLLQGDGGMRGMGERCRRRRGPGAGSWCRP
jgi:hypothetical protein